MPWPHPVSTIHGTHSTVCKPDGDSACYTLALPFRRALIADRKCKVKEEQVRLIRRDKLSITAADTTPEKLASSLQAILQTIPSVVVAGIATVGRAVIQSQEKGGGAVVVSSMMRNASGERACVRGFGTVPGFKTNVAAIMA